MPLRHLAEAAAYLRGETEPPASSRRTAVRPPSPILTSRTSAAERGRRALEIAAAGRHNLLLRPARDGEDDARSRLPGILPALAPDEALEVTRIHSVAGLLLPGRPLIASPPFRAPHTAPRWRPSQAADRVASRRGRASPITACCCSTSCRFVRPALEALRQPLEDGIVSIARAQGMTLFLPASSSWRR